MRMQVSLSGSFLPAPVLFTDVIVGDCGLCLSTLAALLRFHLAPSFALCSVILAVEKRLTSPLLTPSSIEKVLEIDTHIGAAMSGLTADARTLIDHGRIVTQEHRFTYDEPLSVESTTQSLCDLALRFGEDGRDDGADAMARPFGVALLIAGVDESGPALYHTDPSGTYVKWMAKAIGAGSEGAQTALQEAWSAGMTLAEAEGLALKTLKAVMEEKVSGENVEVAAVTAESGKFKVYGKEQLMECIGRL